MYTVVSTKSINHRLVTIKKQFNVL